MRELSKFITDSKTKICFILMYIFGIVTLFFNLWIGIFELLITCIVLFAYLVERKKNDKIMRKHIERLSFNIESATHNSIMNSPFPMVIVKRSGEILWYNDNFGSLINKDEFKSPYIQDMFNEITLTNESEEIVFHIKTNGKYFDVYGVCTKNKEGSESESESIVMYYFVETTELSVLKKKYIDGRIVKGYIYIDNLDELTKNLPDSDRTGIVSKIEKDMYDFVTRYNAVLSRNDRDRYSFITEYGNFLNMKKSKFDILKSVKLTDSSEIPFTLSVGVGVGENLEETENFSKIAIDLALGRGGDQAVVKEGNNIDYFGGNSKEIEKRTKVRSRIIALRYKELVEGCDNVIIMGHKNPDMDCLGSALGMARISKAYGKPTYVILEDQNINVDILMKKLGNNKEYEDLFVSSQMALTLKNENSVIVVLDAHKESLLPCPELVHDCDKVVLVDHHRKGADYIVNTAISFHETYASSTSELVVEMLEYLDDKVKLKKAEAESLYAGILIDTQNFCIKTGVRTFEAASFLRKSGMEPVLARDFLKNDFETYLKVSEIVKSCEFYNENIAIAKYYGEEENSIFIAQAADELIDIRGVEASFVVFKNKECIFISARSNGNVNVQLIMEKLGGGGHRLVAGAQLTDTTVDKAVMNIKELINEETQKEE